MSNSDFIPVGSLIKSKEFKKQQYNNHNNDIKSLSRCIDKNGAKNEKFALRASYSAMSEVAYTAIEISTSLNDTCNFAFHYSTVKKIGPIESKRLLHEVKDDVLQKLKQGSKIKNPAALYNWKVSQLLKNQKRI